MNSGKTQHIIAMTSTLSLLKVVFGILGIIFPCIFASNIFIQPGRSDGSHYSVMLNIAEELLTRGHNVTMLVSDFHEDKISATKNPVEKKIHFTYFKTIITEAEHKEWVSGLTNAALKGEYMKWLMEVSKSDAETRLVLECRNNLDNKQLMSKLLNSNFAALVVDNNQNCPIVQYLRNKSGIPMISLSAVTSIPSVNLFGIRSPFNPSYMPELSSALDHAMSFHERLKNVATSIMSCAVLTLLTNPYYQVRVDFGIPETTPYYDDADMLLINTHFALDFAKPLLPNMGTVGGLTAGPAKPLIPVSVIVYSVVGEM